jgi:hypothetical protein
MAPTAAAAAAGQGSVRVPGAFTMIVSPRGSSLSSSVVLIWGMLIMQHGAHYKSCNCLRSLALAAV